MIDRILIGLAIGAGALCAIVLVGLVAVLRSGGDLRKPRGVLPATLRLLVDLLRDPTVPRGVRWRLVVAIGYAGQPINVIPDFIPVIGYVDNLAVVGWALRSVIRLAGPDTVARQWRGSPQSLTSLYRLLRLADPSEAAACPAGQPAARDPASADPTSAPDDKATSQVSG